LRVKVAIFGLGYVGLTSAACLINDGCDVIGVDVSESKVHAINAGRSPIFEPGVEKLLAQGVEEGRLEALRTIGERLDECDVAIVCVGTPSGIDGSHNMGHIAQVSRQIALASSKMSKRSRPLAVIYRSTMRPGSIEKMIMPIFQEYHGPVLASVDLAYNPEFLREATAIADYYAPPKIVIGTADGKPVQVVEELYAAIEAPRFHVRFREAEITKFVDNSFHALKVAFANEIGRICHRENVSARTVHEIFIADTKLNISPYYLRPGGAFGGSCLPKDVRALSYMAKESNADAFVVDALMASNEAHKRFLYEMATAGLPRGARVLLNGLAFKANSDDLRESPHVDLARRLIKDGFALSIWDPGVDPAAFEGRNLDYSYSYLPELSMLLVRDADALAAMSFDVIIDARNNAAELKLTGVPIVRIDRIA
jgi:GDP-mannose 6-dehydrogenase